MRSRQDAYREFRRLFADHPDLVATVDAEALPVSIRIQLVEGAKRGRLVHSLERLVGVDTFSRAIPAP